jgi:hypothetical protein
MPRPLVIDVSKDLPLRARPLSPETISEIFGGCGAYGEPCTILPNQPRYGTCCPPYYCNGHPNKICGTG